MVTTKKDAARLRGVLQRLKAGPTNLRIPSELRGGIGVEQAVRIEEEMQRQVREWSRLWMNAEIDSLIPDEEKEHTNVRNSQI